MTEHDIKIFGQCASILLTVRDKLITHASRLHDKQARNTINSIAADINDRASRLKARYQTLRNNPNDQ